MQLIMLIIGAVLGVILDRIATEGGLDQKLKKIFRKGRIIGRSPSVSGITPYIYIGDLQVKDWEILDGLFPEGIKFSTSVEDHEVALPKDLMSIRKQIEQELNDKKRRNEPVPYNGKRYAISDVKVHRADDTFESNTCYLRLKYSDYFNFLATSQSLDAYIPGETLTVREKYFSSIDPKNIVHDFLFHSFGVNLAVVTSDERLILVKRGQSVDSLAGVFNSSVNEGLSRDLDSEVNRTVSILHVAVRGLYEEIGITEDEIKEYKLTSIGFSRKWCQYGVLGYALLKITFSELRKRLAVSKDASFEIECLQSISKRGTEKSVYSIYAIRNNPKDFAEFLKTRQIKITSWGLCCYLLSFLASGLYTFSHLEKHFKGQYWRDASFIV